MQSLLDQSSFIDDHLLENNGGESTVSFFKNRDKKYRKELYDMLDMEPRIRLHDFGAFDSEKTRFKETHKTAHGTLCFLPTKNYLHISYGLARISHEIAHWVELGDQYKHRWLLPNWGMATHHDETTVKSFFAGLSRELRARGIEKRLWNDDNKKNYSSRNELNLNIYYKEMASKFLPFGKFKNMNELQEWTDFIHDKAYDDFPIERIMHEWNRRINHYQEWAETNTTNTVELAA